MEKYAKRLQDIINEQDFCFEPDEIRTVERAIAALQRYEDTAIPPADCAEYKKFEDWLVKNNTPFSHVLELLEAEREGRVTIRKRCEGDCCGECHHFLREKGRVSGICEVRTYKHYPRRDVPLYCTQSKKACLDFEERGGRDIRYMGEERRT